MRIRWCILPTLIIIVMLSWKLTIACKAAAGPDFSRKGSVTIVMMNEDTNSPVSGGEVCLYYVAQLQENGLTYSYTDEFAQCGFLLDDLEDDMLPGRLGEYAENRKITGANRVVDESGTAVFDELSLGLYLIVQTKEAEGYYKINPFLITVPIQEENQWVYDVQSLPKMEPISKKPSTSPEPTPTPGPPIWIEPLIPKTGQLWWPVPVLAFMGSICILIGLMLGKRDVKDAE